MILFRRGSPTFLVVLLGLLGQSVAVSNLRGIERELAVACDFCSSKEECVDDACTCKKGYFFNVVVNACEDEDLCVLDYPCFISTVESHDVVPSSFCVDMDPPMEFKCGCLPGFVAVLPLNNASFTEPVPLEYRPTSCLDKDECASDADNSCDDNADCANTFGSYTCTCRDGFEGTGFQCDAVTVVEVTAEVLDACNNSCTDNGLNEECGEDVEGNPDCVCIEGFEHHSNHCRRVAVCDDSPCDENAICEDQPAAGVVICTCKPGFVGGGNGPGECTLTPAPSVMASNSPSGSPIISQQNMQAGTGPTFGPAPTPQCTVDPGCTTAGHVCRVAGVCGPCQIDGDCDGADGGEQCLDNECIKLEAGDIAFLCMQSCQQNASPPCEDAFAFIALVDLPAATKIYFTDAKFIEPPGSGLRDTEGLLLWTAPAFTHAGDVVEIKWRDASASAITIIRSSDLNHATGDSVTAFVGGPGVAMPTFIASISLHRNTFVGTSGAGSTDLPAGLTNKETAIALGKSGSHNVYARYTATIISGTKAELLPVLNDRSNWDREDNPNSYWGDSECVKPNGQQNFDVVSATPPPDYEPGDIAFLCVKGDPMEFFTFVALTTIVKGTSILFTDNGVRHPAGGGSANVFRPREGTLRYSPLVDILPGTIVTYTELSPGNTDFSPRSGNFNPTQGNANDDADQLIAYQGTDTDPFFITALNYDSRFNLASESIDEHDRSALPEGLRLKPTGPYPTAVETAGKQKDNAWRELITARSGTKAELLRRIYNPTKWDANNNGAECPNGLTPFLVDPTPVP